MTIRLHLPSGETIAVERPLVVGRLPECDVVIADPLVSGRHFEIGPAPGGAQIIDLQSSNGTFVDGERLQAPRVLVGGESIAVGSQRVDVERVVEVKPLDLRLTVRVGADTGKAVQVSAGAPLTVGRADDADLQLSDPLVSAIHCRVVTVRPPAGPCPHCGTIAEAGDAHCVGCGRERVAAEVEDLGSANGVLVDGAPVATNGRADLLEGGEIQVGDTVIVFASESDPVAAGPAPTVIRSIPRGLDAPAPPTSPAPPISADKRRIPLIAVLLGGLAVVAIAAVAIIAIVSSGGDAPHDAVWVQETQRNATVEVGACSAGTDNCYGGSGSVIDAEQGLVLTNYHTLSDDDTGNLLPNIEGFVRRDGSDKWLDATVVGYLVCDDLAVLQIKDPDARQGLGQVELANPGSIKIGESVVALGYPATLESDAKENEQMTVTTGVVSKLGVSLATSDQPKQYPNLIQTDADINHGNSGGPLFDLEGRQIGVNTLGGPDKTSGINYAISVERVEEVLGDLRDGKKVAGYSACGA